MKDKTIIKLLDTIIDSSTEIGLEIASFHISVNLWDQLNLEVKSLTTFSYSPNLELSEISIKSYRGIPIRIKEISGFEVKYSSDVSWLHE